ncbi:MAG: hypothetical protein Q7S22_07380 [Candidatus Micrarchaeota archaeon]|nr:hypothetical protein [Candidatus Micrarchaeota archaeon]
MKSKFIILLIFSLFLIGCTSTQKKDVIAVENNTVPIVPRTEQPDNEPFQFSLVKLTSNGGYLSIELINEDTIGMETLPSIMAAVSPKVTTKKISKQKLKDLKDYVKKQDFFSWENESDMTYEVTKISITLGEDYNSVTADDNSKSKRFKDLEDKIVELTN